MSQQNFRDEWKKRVDAFNKRRIYSQLTIEILSTIPDDKLVQAILDYIDTKVKDHRAALIDVSKMSPGFQMVKSTVILEGEVNNGGFNQFFFNKSRQYTDLALQSLKMIGASDYYEILQKAIGIYIKEQENEELQKLYAQKTPEAFSNSYKLTSLGECDSAFYKLENSLSEIRVHYIRSHPESFVGN